MSEVIVFEDQNFEKLIRNKLNIFYRPITIDDAKKVKELTIMGWQYRVKSLKGIEYFTELESLNINQVKLEKGISTLINSSKLKYLILKKCGLKDTSGIEKLERLDTLDLSYNENIKNFDPLGLLKNIKCLFLSGCNLSDLEFLKPIKTLIVLEIDRNKLNDELELDYIVQNNPIEHISYKYNPIEERLKFQKVSIPNRKTRKILRKKLHLETKSITDNDLRYITYLNINNEKELDAIKYYKNLKGLTIEDNVNLKSSLLDKFGKFNNIKSVIIYDRANDNKCMYTIDEYVQIEKSIAKIVNGINKKWTEVEKARYIYEILGQTITYDYSGYYSKAKSYNEKEIERIIKTRTLYGPLVEGKAVCMGNANAYSEVCNRIGIKCECVHGDIPGIENSGHTWNMININGKWFHCDLTLDELNIKQGKNLKYFCKSEKTIEKDHRILLVNEKCKSNISQEDINDKRVKAAEMKLGIRSCNDRIKQLERGRFNGGFKMLTRMKEYIFKQNKANEMAGHEKIK